MTTPKASYGGDDTGIVVPEFPQTVRQKLRKWIVAHATNSERGRIGKLLFTAEQIGAHRAFMHALGAANWRQTHPADEIVGQLLDAAYGFKVELHRHRRFALKKGELLAEHADLLKTVREAQKKLRSISMELDRLFHTKSDPLGLADQLGDFAVSVERATLQVRRRPALPRDRVFGGRIAANLAHAVIRVFDANDLPTTATINPGKVSLLLDTLTAIGDAMGLALSAHAWKNHVSAARKASRTTSTDR